jgi:hypothetical protein
MRKERRMLEEKIDSLDRFTGSLTEYNILKGCEHVPMDTGRPKKYVSVDYERETELIRLLMDNGCTGFIRYVPKEPIYLATIGGFGIPVRKK